MEIFRLKVDKFNLERFIHYYNDNIEELLYDFPHYICRPCLIDLDYMDVVVFDEDYEDINTEKDYEELLLNNEYALHFAVGKTFENTDKIELIDGNKYRLSYYLDDMYEDDNTIKNIGDLSLNVDNLIGLLFEHEEEDDEIVVYTTDFEHGGEISQPRVRRCDDPGDLEEILKNMLERFITE